MKELHGLNLAEALKVEARDTLNTDRAELLMAASAEIALLVMELRSCAQLRQALQAIVALDDGDNPGLWPYEKEFSHARAAIAHATKVQP